MVPSLPTGLNHLPLYPKVQPCCLIIRLDFGQRKWYCVAPCSRLAYFAFYLTLCRSRTHQWTSLSFMFSRPESGSQLPAGCHSCSDLAIRAAAIIPSAAFKHIPFALQFVQPGIVTSLATPFPTLPLLPGLTL